VFDKFFAEFGMFVSALFAIPAFSFFIEFAHLVCWDLFVLKHMKTSHARANSAMYKYLDKKEIRNLNYYHIVHSILISVP